MQKSYSYSRELIVSGIVVFLGMYPAANAELIRYDGFDYSAGNLSRLNTGDAWSRTGTGDNIMVVDGNLSHSGLPDPTGKMIQWGGDGQFSGTSFTSRSSGNIYASFLFRMDTLTPLTTTGGGLASMVNAENVNNINARVYVRKDAVNANAMNFGIKERNAAISWDPAVYLTGTTHFLVFSLNMLPGSTDDVASLWVNPTLGATTAPTAAVTSTGGTDAAKISRFRFIQNPSNGSAGLQSADELRIGTAWSDVTPIGVVPEPATALTLLIGGVLLGLIRRFHLCD